MTNSDGLKVPISAAPPEPGVVVTTHGVKVPIGPHVTTPVWEYLRAGGYEALEARVITERLRRDDVVVEVGGGLGFTSALCAQRINPADVHVYEADPSMQRAIEELYHLNGLAPDLHMYALGPSDGTMVLHVTEHFWESSSIQPNAPVKATVTVPVRSFEREMAGYARRPNFLIIDIEGGEFDFFREVSLTGIDKILCEVHYELLGSEKVRDLEGRFRGKGFIRDESMSTAAVWYLEHHPHGRSRWWAPVAFRRHRHT
jgi:FkbM family methyltransferase